MQEGQTLTNSIANVAEGRTDITAVPIILPFLLNLGSGPFSKQGENGKALASNLRAIYPYNAGAFGLLASDSKNITKWPDLKGKTVFNGPPRGAALVNARQAIQLASGLVDGKGYQPYWGQLATILVDGSADAFVIPLTFPSSRVTIALSGGAVSIISTPKDVFESEAYQKVFNAPENIPIIMP